MAVVIRCDRCERIIEDRAAVTFISAFEGVRAQGGVEEVELCRACSKAFWGFLKEERKDELR